MAETDRVVASGERVANSFLPWRADSVCAPVLALLAIAIIGGIVHRTRRNRSALTQKNASEAVLPATRGNESATIKKDEI